MSATHSRSTGRGIALPDGIGYAIPELPSGRESFAPDASHYVDPRAETVAVHRATAPTQAIVYRQGDTADAEPAVPPRTMPVADMFAV